MGNELRIFENTEFGQVRTVELNGEAWLVGKDVAEILGYSNPRKALIDHIDEEDKGVTKCDTLGGKQDLTIINESGLYSLVLSSKLPTAKKFKRWVTSEVLPAIRKHGVYMIDEMLNNPDAVIEALQAYKEERQKRLAAEAENVVKDQQIAELQPKASYYDVVLNCKDLVSTTQIAKDYGWSGAKLNQYLADKKVQFKQGQIWLLYQKYARMGYTSTKTHSYAKDDGSIHSKVHTYWTQKGRLFIYQLLKADGIVPMIEDESNDYV